MNWSEPAKRGPGHFYENPLPVNREGVFIALAYPQALWRVDGSGHHLKTRLKIAKIQDVAVLQADLAVHALAIDKDTV